MKSIVKGIAIGAGAATTLFAAIAALCGFGKKDDCGGELLEEDDEQKIIDIEEIEPEKIETDTTESV